ncbi:MAG: hypothetical protein KJP09_07930 [Bacteroidia bacterium]|nr:hypothetical protein [Bacteroidia bacterium]NND10629.1 hypothetical protein [Flavobacteriaceae bacterium]MBT8309832.1 hypothetical protein [Bacteroidia bacterium]NNK26642.1 hypothetical protein [Flavobacteriaceae bacterium]NNL61808.1 hypothetical protein [Flavobacteriaceae bacterium]
MVNSIILLLVLTREESIILSFGSVAIFFLILLISGLIKTRKLNEENRKLMESIELNLKDSAEKDYEDFRDSHSYKNES